ncbi:MAG: tetratricopeptide repeat protein [Planctomyces sp.]|nr:tetratricopeptide repeat protein [Planctomyces sp.]
MIRTCLSLVLLAVLTAPAFAAGRELEFLERLREQGLGDMAVAHLQNLESRSEIPSELQEVIDLEFARALIAEAETTQNVDRASSNLVLARERLSRFLEQHAGHPDAGIAWRSVGQISLSRGERLRQRANLQRAAGRRATELDQARTELETARPAFARAIELFGARVAQLQDDAAPPRAPARRARRSSGPSELDLALEDWLESRFLAAQVDYLIAMTSSDPEAPARREALERASRGFDDIFQGYREKNAGILAHFWHGRAQEALGQHRLALDIYQEVLGNAPELGESGAAARLPFFADVKRDEVRMLQALRKDDDAFSEAQQWLDRWQGFKQLPGYQALAIDFSRMLEARAAGLEKRESERLIGNALTLLAEISRIAGPHQTEAIRLRRELSSRIGRTLEINTFADAVALAEAAADGGDWPQAVTLYQQALSLSKDVRPPQRIDQIRFELARAQFSAGQLDASFETASALAREQPPRDSGPAAAVLAISAALQLAATGSDRDAARQRLLDIANYTQSTWPRRAEADEATLALGRLQLVDGAADDALQTFDRLDPASERYPQARLLVAQTRWRQLQLDRRAGPIDEAELTSRREAVLDAIRGAIESPAAASASSEGALDELRLLMAEVLQDAGRLDEAVALYEPLIDQMLVAGGEGLSPLARRVAIGAASAYLAQGDVGRARSVADRLAAAGEDSPAVNSVLVAIAQALRNEWQRAAAEALEAAASGDEARQTTADEALAAEQAAVSGYVELLCQREQLSLDQQVRLGDIASELGRGDLARQQYERVLERAESAGAAADRRVQSALTRVRSQLIGLLRKDRNFEQALAEVDKLLAANPSALEPNVERARILQALAEQDATRYPEAVAAWTRLRTAMSKLPRKPPEFYEAVYGSATSLAGQAANASDSRAAEELRRQAATLLRSTLALAPQLSGPDMVERYRQLIDELAP